MQLVKCDDHCKDLHLWGAYFTTHLRILPKIIWNISVSHYSVVILLSRLVPSISTLFWYFVIATKRNISYPSFIIEWYTHSFHFTIKIECEKSLMCTRMHKTENKKDNSLLDLFGIFSQSPIKWLVSQQINRLPHVNFVLPNSCVNILYNTVSFKF